MQASISRPTIRSATAPIGLAIAILALNACANKSGWTDTAAHKSAFVTVNGIRMNYLDWGGNKPVLILIHGFQDNPHVFDDLAPAFTDHFRVIAYARRGHGDSEAKGPYNTANLTEDLRTLMDSLHIAKADIAGWSMGGNEVTMMAGVHPDRVDRVVYLEGAYDWGDPAVATAFQAFGGDMSAPHKALQSMQTFHKYEVATYFPMLTDLSPVEAYIRDLVVPQPDGSVKMKMSDSTQQALLQVLLSDRRDYTKVHAPALAIFATTFEDVQHGSASDNATLLAWEQKYMMPFRNASMERVRKEIPGIEVVNVPGTHMGFLFESRDQVVDAMRRFLEPAARPESGE